MVNDDIFESCVEYDDQLHECLYKEMYIVIYLIWSTAEACMLNTWRKVILILECGVSYMYMYIYAKITWIP